MKIQDPIKVPLDGKNPDSIATAGRARIPAPEGY